MRVLITGATGFVGGWLANEIAANRPDARIVGTTTHRHAGLLLPPFSEMLACDLTDQADVLRVAREARADVVFHLAGFASGAGTDADFIRRVNVDGTISLLTTLRDEAARSNTPCRVLLASSGYVYGATSPNRPATEADALHPQGAYAQSKAAMEEAVASLLNDNGDSSPPLSVVICRSFNHSGPRQMAEFVVPAFAKQIAEIERGLLPPVVRHGNLLAVRDFLHVRDVVRAYRLLMNLSHADDAKPDRPPLSIVNVASGVGITIQSLLDSLLAQARIEIASEADPARMRPSDLPLCVGGYSLLQNETGWRPHFSVETMLADTLAYWREQTTA